MAKETRLQSKTPVGGITDTSEDAAAPLAYSRRLYGNIVDWYKNAETKAQILLSLDGIFVSLLVASLFRDPAAAGPILDEFGYETWVAVATVVIAMASSVVCALMCLISRIMPRSEIEGRYPEVLADARSPTYPPEVMWFFQTISRLDEEEFCEQTMQVTHEIETRALASQNFLLSGKVLKKHIWVNWGFAFAALGLISLLISGGSYVLRVGS